MTEPIFKEFCCVTRATILPSVLAQIVLDDAFPEKAMVVLPEGYHLIGIDWACPEPTEPNLLAITRDIARGG